MRSLRTTFATWCSQAGYDSACISRWLGHKPVGMAKKHYNKHKMRRFEDAMLTPTDPGTVAPFPKLPESVLGLAEFWSGRRR